MNIGIQIFGQPPHHHLYYLELFTILNVNVEDGLNTLKIVNMSKIIEIKKNKTNYVQIELREYEGHPYVDVREFYDGEDGKRMPTKKGITFTPKVLGQVIDGLVELQNNMNNG